MIKSYYSYSPLSGEGSIGVTGSTGVLLCAAKVGRFGSSDEDNDSNDVSLKSVCDWKDAIGSVVCSLSSGLLLTTESMLLTDDDELIREDLGEGKSPSNRSCTGEGAIVSREGGCSSCRLSEKLLCSGGGAVCDSAGPSLFPRLAASPPTTSDAYSSACTGVDLGFMSLATNDGLSGRVR